MRFVELAMYFVFVSLGSAALANETVARFPGPPASLRSPNDVFLLYDKDHDGEPYHSLFIENISTGETRKILDFSRYTDVSWAPNSSMFFINNYFLSNASDCSVISAHHSYKTINVFKMVRKILKKNELRSNHLYTTCTGWDGETSVDVFVYGYGHGASGSNGFERRYQLEVKSGGLKVR
jgi:hypothetical protein